MPMCMDCETAPATWRSDDGYPFCETCAHQIYTFECELSGVEPLTRSAWITNGRPHGPD